MTGRLGTDGMSRHQQAGSANGRPRRKRGRYDDFIIWKGDAVETSNAHRPLYEVKARICSRGSHIRSTCASSRCCRHSRKHPSQNCPDRHGIEASVSPSTSRCCAGTTSSWRNGGAASSSTARPSAGGGSAPRRRALLTEVLHRHSGIRRRPVSFRAFPQYGAESRTQADRVVRCAHCGRSLADFREVPRLARRPASRASRSAHRRPPAGPRLRGLVGSGRGERLGHGDDGGSRRGDLRRSNVQVSDPTGAMVVVLGRCWPTRGCRAAGPVPAGRDHRARLRTAPPGARRLAHPVARRRGLHARHRDHHLPADDPVDRRRLRRPPQQRRRARGDGSLREVQSPQGGGRSASWPPSWR